MIKISAFCPASPPPPCDRGRLPPWSILNVVPFTLHYWTLSFTKEMVAQVLLKPATHHLTNCDELGEFDRCSSICVSSSVNSHMLQAFGHSAFTRNRTIGKDAEAHSEVREVPYETALQQPRLFSLNYRRIRGDPIPIFKITRGHLGFPMGSTFTHLTV